LLINNLEIDFILMMLNMVPAVDNKYINISYETFISIFMFQSVTGTPNADDVNSYWQVRGDIKHDCERG
jgi:hypothetical protein